MQICRARDNLDGQLSLVVASKEVGDKVDPFVRTPGCRSNGMGLSSGSLERKREPDKSRLDFERQRPVA